MKKTSPSLKIILLTVSIGLILSIINSLFIFSEILSLISIIIIPLGALIYQYNKYRESKEIEEKFPDFLRDVSENIRTGMTIPQAITATKDTYYGALTPYIKKIVVQIDWGVPFDEILTDFSNRSTKSLKRTISTIIDTYRGGGDIADVFDSIGRSTVEINRINKERSSMIYSQMLTGYIIFFVFIGVLVMMQAYLIPGLQSFSAPELGISAFETIGKFYSDIFRLLIVLQGFFSGIIIGKLSEGSVIAGLKHSLFLIILGYLILWFFI